MRLLTNIVDAGLGLARAFARSEHGGPASEFAMTAPIFIVLILGTFQIGIIYFANAYLETAAEQAARLVLTNNATTTSNGATTPMNAQQFQTAVCGNISMLFTCGNIMINLAPATSETSISTAAPTFNANGTLANNLNFQIPPTGQIGVLQIMYEWPVIGLPLGVTFGSLGNGAYLMMSTQVFMVEPAT